MPSLSCTVELIKSESHAGQFHSSVILILNLKLESFKLLFAVVMSKYDANLVYNELTISNMATCPAACSLGSRWLTLIASEDHWFLLKLNDSFHLIPTLISLSDRLLEELLNKFKSSMQLQLTCFRPSCVQPVKRWRFQSPQTTVGAVS